MKYFSTRKDKKKFIRGVIQGLILLVLLFFLFKGILNINKYQHSAVVTEPGSEKDRGFIALSYFAVDRNGTDTMISTKRLDEHFEALNKNGYTTLRQKDIEDYYKNGKIIPKRSMFLMFEDGRRDTAIFSGALIEKYNYIGTVWSAPQTVDKMGTVKIH